MKKIFFFLAALMLSFTAQATIVECNPGTNNLAWYLTQGDTLVLADGIYEEAYSIDFTKPGVCVKAAEGAKPVIKLTGEWTALEVTATTTFDGITFDAGNVAQYLIATLDSTTFETDLTIKNCEFKNWNNWAISHYYQKNVSVNSIVIDNCLFHDAKNSAVYFSQNAPEGKNACQDLKITNSTFYNIGDESAYTTVYCVGGNAVEAQKVTVDYCTFYNCQAKNTDHAAVRITCAATISNTIIAAPASQGTYRAIHAADGSNAQAINCLTYNYEKDNGGIRSSVTKTNCQLNVDPKFVGAANGNFALAEGSPALTAGTDGKAIGDPRWNAPAVEKVTVTLSDNTGGFEPLTSGGGEYKSGEEVTVTASEDLEDWIFLGWTVDGEFVANDPEYTFVVDSNIELVAVYATNLGQMNSTDLVIDGDNMLLTASLANFPLGTLKLELKLGEYDEDEEAYSLTEESKLSVGETNFTFFDGMAVVDMESNAAMAIVVFGFEGMYFHVIVNMSAAPAKATDIVVTDATIIEDNGILFLTAPWEAKTIKAELPSTEHQGWMMIEIHEGEDFNIVMSQNATIATVDNVLTITGVFTDNYTGAVYNVTISGKLPVEEKPEPTYTENKLNPYAFGLESVLSDDKATLTVTYRLNNSNATSVNVVVYNGEKVVATVPGTTTIGKNTVEVATGNLPAGVELKWAVEVNGTSVEAPTQETKMYNMYCPHGLAIDKDPESEYFGRILVADAMNIVKDKAGYLGSGIGAGLHAFNPSFTTDSTVYQGGNDFTRILASNGYQPWRVKISEDGRIFVSSLDLNGVVVWEVSKDLQTWTPVIAGTNDATDHNIYDADGNFVAGLNCSMDVTGKGEDLKLLLYSTNNKGIAFNQSGYRLDEYALGTATTWTGTPKNILEGGKLGVVHTNVEFIYDGEGGYWFGASRAGNAGQPNLVHINAAGEQDYYTEDASLYGGDGVLVHNGMLFKGKARTSGTVGNFGVWTIGKDADGKVTLTEKWTVVADGIGRNLNEFAVDYAENLYVVGNSGEKIIAYALPYSGKVETPAAAKYAFQLPEPLKMAGVVKRAVQNGDQVIVLTHEENGTAHIYQVVDGKPVAELSQTGVIARDPENAGDLLALSDIAATEDGKLVATNYMITQSDDGQVVAGDKRGETRIYIWNDLAADPTILLKSKMSSNWFQSKQGLTMAVKGTSDNMEIFMTGIHKSKAWARVSSYRIINGVYTEPDVNHNDHYFFYDVNDAIALETTVGTQYELSASPLGKMNWILDANLINPVEIVESAANNTEIATSVALAQDLGKKYQGTSIVTVGEQHLMVAPYANADGKLVGVKVLDITAGLDKAAELKVADLDAAVEATAAATAVAVKENVLTITLVADAALHTLVVELVPATSGITLTATGVETELEEDGSYTLEGKAVVNGDESNLMDFALFVYPTEGYTDVVLNNYSVMIFGAPTPDAFVENEDGTFTYTAQIEDTYGDGTIYNINISGTIKKTEGPVYTEKEDEITNMVFDFDNMVMYGGPSTNYEVEVFLGLAEDNLDGTFTLSSESSVAIKGIDAEFIEGYAYDIDLSAPSAKAVVKVNWDGMYYAFTLTMTAAPLEAIEIVITDATVEVEEWKDFPEAPTTNYALTMTADWTNPADSVVYPVKVELPIYDPNATEPVDALSMVKVGDGETLLGVVDGEYLKVTTVEGVVTATGLVANPATGFAVNITISGKLPETAVDNIQMGVKATKVIKNGQLIIINNDVEYNAQGAVVK